VGDGPARGPSVSLAPADGSPIEVLWRNDADGFRIHHVWPVGDGSHVISASQIFDDGQPHLALWQVSASRARLLACSPQTANEAGAGTTLAVSESAFYFTTSPSMMPLNWAFVRVPR